MVRKLPKHRLMSEEEWRAVGIQQSEGWVHYMIHEPEPHVVLFRRPRTDVTVSEVTSTGDVKAQQKV